MKSLNATLEALADRWWVPLGRGIAAIIFGALTIIWPGLSLFSLVLILGLYALIDGAMSMAYSIGSDRRALSDWGWVLVEGLLGVVVGVEAILFPQTMGEVLLRVIAAWAIVIGAMQIAAAIVLRRALTGPWHLVVSGVLALSFGALLVAFPAAGALSIAWLIGANAIAFGVVLIALSVRLYRLGHDSGTRTHAAPHAA